MSGARTRSMVHTLRNAAGIKGSSAARASGSIIPARCHRLRAWVALLAFIGCTSPSDVDPILANLPGAPVAAIESDDGVWLLTQKGAAHVNSAGKVDLRAFSQRPALAPAATVLPDNGELRVVGGALGPTGILLWGFDPMYSACMPIGCTGARGCGGVTVPCGRYGMSRWLQPGANAQAPWRRYTERGLLSSLLVATTPLAIWAFAKDGEVLDYHWISWMPTATVFDAAIKSLPFLDHTSPVGPGGLFNPYDAPKPDVSSVTYDCWRRVPQSAAAGAGNELWLLVEGRLLSDEPQTTQDRTVVCFVRLDWNTGSPRYTAVAVATEPQQFIPKLSEAPTQTWAIATDGASAVATRGNWVLTWSGLSNAPPVHEADLEIGGHRNFRAGATVVAAENGAAVQIAADGAVVGAWRFPAGWQLVGRAHAEWAFASSDRNGLTVQDWMAESPRWTISSAFGPASYCPGPLADCDDANPCTYSTCEKSCGHIPRPDGAYCSPGKACTGGVCVQKKP